MEPRSTRTGDDDGRRARHGFGRRARHGLARRPRERRLIAFLRANPQAFVLLVICAVLGLGTFLAVLFGLLTAGSGQGTGEPSGVIAPARVTLAALRLLSG